jgi:hypothetical protein
MNLLFDKNSLLSSHDITINNYIEDEHYYVDRSRPNSDFSYDDLTNEEQATVSIDDDTTFTMSLNIPGS